MPKAAKAEHVGVDFQDTHSVRQKLIKEIKHLERQAAHMSTDSGHVDFCMIQTYKELIHSRQVMLNQLPH